MGLRAAAAPEAARGLSAKLRHADARQPPLVPHAGQGPPGAAILAAAVRALMAKSRAPDPNLTLILTLNLNLAL